MLRQEGSPGGGDHCLRVPHTLLSPNFLPKVWGGKGPGLSDVCTLTLKPAPSVFQHVGDQTKLVLWSSPDGVVWGPGMVSILIETGLGDLGSSCPSLLCFLSQGWLVQNIPEMSRSFNTPSGTQHT